MVNRLTDAIGEKAPPELLDIMTDDVVLLTTSGPPTVGRDAAKMLCTDLFGRFDIRKHVDFGVEVHAAEGAATILEAYLMTLTPLDGAAPVEMRGRVWMTLRRESGTWKLARGLNWVVATVADADAGF